MGIYAWGEGLPKAGQYFVYCSEVMDHSPWFVIAVLGDLTTRLPPASVVRNTLWADVGLHFRAYRTLGWWLGHLPETRREEATVEFFPDGHGKGRLDGAFGVYQHLTHEVAKKLVASSVSDFAQVQEKTISKGPA